MTSVDIGFYKEKRRNPCISPSISTIRQDTFEPINSHWTDITKIRLLLFMITKLPTCENAEKLPEVPIYNQIVRSFHGYFNITFCSLEFYFHFIFFISELILRILNSSCVFYEEITQGHNVIFDLLTNDLSCTIKKV